MMIYNTIKVKALIFTCVFLIDLSSQAAITVGATPSGSEQEMIELYQPMLDKLTEALGQEVVFEYAKNWLIFSKKIVSRDFDILISEPHIIAYVTSQTSTLDMKAIARFPGELTYHVVTNADNSVNKIKQLQSKRICMFPSPSFSGVMIMKEFVSNPVTQPSVVEVRGSYQNVYEKLKQQRCDAAVIDDINFNRLNTIDETITTIYQTKPSPNVGVAISIGLPQQDRSLIQEVILNMDTGANMPLFDLYSQGVGPFLITDDQTYQPVNILPGVVWGW